MIKVYTLITLEGEHHDEQKLLGIFATTRTARVAANKLIGNDTQCNAYYAIYSSTLGRLSTPTLVSYWARHRRWVHDAK